jgi:putative ABC transport system permease protein
MRPPSLARRLLAWTVSASDRDDVLDDLDDLYALRRASWTRGAADVWYWGQVIAFPARLWVASKRDDEAARTGARALLRHFVEDVRFGFRSFRKSPAFPIAAVATLALGLAANTVIFAVVNAAILRPLPFPEPDKLVWVWPGGEVSLTQGQFEELKDRSAALDLSAFAYRNYAIQGGESPREVSGVSVSTNHFDVFELRPVLGRGLEREDGFPGAEPTAVISHRLWQGQFGADSAVIGRRVDVFMAASIPMVPGAFTGAPHTIVGVLPPRYRPFGFQADVYTPLVVDPSHPSFSNMRELTVVGRLTLGQTPQSAQSELVTLSSEVPALQSVQEEIARDRVMGLREAVFGNIRPAMLLTLGAVAMILLIACVNVANLILVRTQAREREFAIRRALGAGRGRLTRQLVTESVLLSAISAAVGVGLAYLLLPSLMSVLPAGIAPLDGVPLSWPVVAYSGGALALTTLLATAGPFAVRSTRPGGTRRGSRGGVGFTRRHRVVNSILVVSQLAMALVLVHGASMLMRSFGQLSSLDVGFDSANVVAMRVAPSSNRYSDPDIRRGLYAQILERTRAIPGVVQAGAVHFLPIADGRPTVGFLLDPADSESRRASGYRVVTTDYVETLRIPVLRGRSVSDEDVRGAPPVGMVNRTLAERLWPQEDPIGRTVYRTNGSVMFTVVGVVGDVRQGVSGLPIEPEMYVPMAQSEWASVMNVVVRTSGSVPRLDAQLRRIVADVDPGVPVTRIQSMEAVVADSMSSPRFYGMLFSAFALMALVLGGIGVYSVVSSVVAERTDEIGVRLALGATSRSILIRELRLGAKTLLPGIVLGVLGTLFTSRLLGSLVFEISPSDPVVIAATSLVLGAVAATGIVVPACRASRTDPMNTIRAAD